MTYSQLVYKGEAILKENYGWLFLGLAALVGVYAVVHRLVMKEEAQGSGHNAKKYPAQNPPSVPQ
jgi:hypothetical protein